MSGENSTYCLTEGADYVAIGRVAILNHDFPNRIRNNLVSTVFP